MSADKYRVQVYLTGFDKDRASELKSILKIYNRDKGNAFFKSVLRRAWEGEKVLLHQTNDDTDAKRMAIALLRGGGQVAIDGLQEEEDEF